MPGTRGVLPGFNAGRQNHGARNVVIATEGGVPSRTPAVWPFRMKWRLKKRSLLAIGAVGTLGAIVLLLAVLQYRWTGQVSAAEQDRMRASLANSVRQFRLEFTRDFQRLCSRFQTDPEDPATRCQSNVLHAYGDWAKSASYPDFVSAVYVWRTGGEKLLRVNPATSRFEKADWPADFETLRGILTRQSDELASVSGREAFRFPWIFQEQTPALIHPLFHIDRGDGAAHRQAQLLGFLIIQINSRFLRREYLPELVDRHFGNGDRLIYQVTVRSARQPFQVIYQSNPEMLVSAAPADAEANILGPPDWFRGRGRGPMVVPGGEATEWHVVARHRSGSLEAAVSSLRRRNLAVSFGLLFLLAASMALILVLAQRAQKLAELQMEFVAGVSHELRTPLAVICSAGDNLADGVVDDQRRIREYGGFIRDEGRRLAGMVEQVLLFAAGKFDRSGIELRPVQVAAAVDRALASVGPLLDESGFSVEREIAEGLPAVMGDANVLGQCLENLLNNAVKYSGANRWLGVRARTVDGARPEVQISVEDRGRGIPAADLPHLFDPFYRSQAAREDQIRGVGLGLHLVRRMMEGMGGRVSVVSRTGQGSTFTLHLPVPAAGDVPHENDA